MSPSAAERAALACEVLRVDEAVAAGDDVELHGMSPSGRGVARVLGGASYGRRGRAHPPDCRISRPGMPYVGLVGMTERLVGRHGERARLEALLRPRRAAASGAHRPARRRGGRGQDAAGRRGRRRRRAARPARRGDARAARAPYGPLVAALRSRLRAQPGAPGRRRPAARRSSRCCCPSWASPPRRADRPTLFEALRARFAHLAADRARGRAARRPAVVRRGDARGARGARRAARASCRCSCSPPTGPTGCRASHGAPPPAQRPAPRGPRSRSSCSARSRRRRPRPCSREALGAAPDPALARAIHARAQGIPFFAEELAAARCGA